MENKNKNIVPSGYVPVDEKALRWPPLHEDDVFMFDKFSNMSAGIIQLGIPENSDLLKRTKYYRNKFKLAKQEASELQLKNDALHKELSRNKSENKNFIKENSRRIETEQLLSAKKQKRKNKKLIVLEEQILNEDAKPESKIYGKTIS